jgi:hypothetical protein
LLTSAVGAGACVGEMPDMLCARLLD